MWQNVTAFLDRYLIPEWRKLHQMFSVWFFVFIAIAPDAYNAISSMGWLDQVPDQFKWTIRILATVGIFSRLMKQGIAAQLNPQPDPTPPAGAPN